MFLICDGKADCKHKEDEANCNHANRKGNLPTALNLCHEISRWQLSFYDILCVPNINDHSEKVCTLTAQMLSPLSLDVYNHYDILINDTDSCIFQLDSCGHLVNDTSGKHLINCTHFKCTNNYFKCPGFFCIPLRYLCDGTWHCPGGLDEGKEQCTRVSCPGQVKCNSSAVCVHRTSVCDGIVDCPYGDDEYLCTQKVPLCRSWCTCLFFSISCKNLSSSLIKYILGCLLYRITSFSCGGKVKDSLHEMVRCSPWIKFGETLPCRVR